MTARTGLMIYRGIQIIPYDLPGGWGMWCDDARDVADVAPSVQRAREQIDEHLEGAE